MKRTPRIIYIAIITLILILAGCTKAYWMADPNYERLLLAYPPMNIYVNTDPPGARVVIATLRNPQLYANYAPISVAYRPHPGYPAWLMIGKKGYRSTAIRLDHQTDEVHMLVVLAMVHEDEQSMMDMSGPTPWSPISGGSRGQAGFEQFYRQMTSDPHTSQPTTGPRR